MEKEEEVKALKPWQEKVKGAYSDRQFEQDEDFDNAADELIDDLTQKNGTVEKANAKLREILLGNPEVADFLAMLMEGAGVKEALARCIDMDNIEAVEGEPDFDKWKKATEDRRAKVDSMHKYDQELTANKVEATAVFDKWVQEKAMSEPEADQFLDQLDDVLSTVYKGKITVDFLNAMYNGLNYEETLTREREAAGVEARNQEIELKRTAAPKGDGLPKVTASADTETPPPSIPAGGEFFDRLERKKQNR